MKRVDKIVASNHWKTFRKVTTVFLALTFLLISGLGISIVGPLLPPDAHEKGVSKLSIGFISGVFDATSVVCGFVVPSVMHLLNMNTFFCSGLAIFSIGTVLFGLMTYISTNWLYVFLSLIIRAITGIGYSVSWFTLFPILFALYPSNKGQITGLTEVFFEIGCIAGPLTASILLYITSYSITFIIAGSVGLLGTVFCFFFMLPHSDKTDLQLETEPISKTDPEKPKDNVKLAVVKCCKSKEVMLISIPFFINSSLQGLIGVFLSPYLIKYLGIDETMVGLYFVPYPLTALALAPVFGQLVDHNWEWITFVFSPLMGFVACLILLSLTIYESESATGILILGLCLIGAVYVTGYISSIVLLDNIFERLYQSGNSTESRVIMSSWNNITYTAGRTLGGIIVGGFVFDFFGFQATICTQLGLYAVSSAISAYAYFLFAVDKTTDDSRTSFLETSPDVSSPESD